MKPSLFKYVFLSALIGAGAQAAENPWRAMAREDLAFTERYVREQYVTASYPDPKAFAQRLAAAHRTAAAELPKVDSFQGYKALLQRYMNGLDDEHDWVQFNLSAIAFKWPGFLLAYKGRHYITDAAEAPGAPENGLEVTECDGTPIQNWIERVEPFSGGHPGLESTKAAAAHAFLINQGNPFLKAPTRCTIGGKAVDLAWQSLPLPQFLGLPGGVNSTVKRETSVAPFGQNGAWVRLGVFGMETEGQAAEFRAAMAQAPSLRDKSVIVLDVRGNLGGPYNWFMAFLRELYGQPYADYYARARLDIHPVFRASPETAAFLGQDEGDGEPLPADSPLTVPADPPNDAANGDESAAAGIKAALAAGKPVFAMKHTTPARTGEAPANPVRAKVYVLTDYQCASSCISFVDELKLFPGVTQIGLETSVDNRTGTPMPHALPSGNGAVVVATMIRDGRARGDGVPQKPAYEFPGDINDTEVVRHWIAANVITHDKVAGFQP